MKKLTTCTLVANAITAMAGKIGVIEPDALTNTGFGLLSIATISTVNTVVKNPKTRKKLATLILIGNLAIAGAGVHTMLDENSTVAAGAGQMALAGASSVQALKAMGLSDDENRPS